MSDKEKGEILRKVSELPPMQKERALGFLQGLAAASTGTVRSAPQPEQEKKENGVQNDG